MTLTTDELKECERLAEELCVKWDFPRKGEAPQAYGTLMLYEVRGYLRDALEAGYTAAAGKWPQVSAIDRRAIGDIILERHRLEAERDALLAIVKRQREALESANKTLMYVQAEYARGHGVTLIHETVQTNKRALAAFNLKGEA